MAIVSVIQSTAGVFHAGDPPQSRRNAPFMETGTICRATRVAGSALGYTYIERGRDLTFYSALNRRAVLLAC